MTHEPDRTSRTIIERVAGADALVAPILLFVCAYVAALFVLTWLRFPFIQWTGLISVSVATIALLLGWERGRWSIGLAAPLARAVSEFGSGALFGALLIGVCATIVAMTTPVDHAAGNGFPWLEVMAVFAPAAVHEELLFRGYVFQKLREWHRWFAIVLIAAVFAALHAGNSAVSNLGLANIFLGGILLGLAYERHLRLWFPIGLHLAWNVMTGPILGHEVSGYESMRTLLVERGDGPAWATGGDFGIEGSVWMTVVEVAAIVLLLKSAGSSRQVVAFESSGRRV